MPIRTSLRVSNGRIVMRTRASLVCAACGTRYHPRVHACPGLAVGLGVIAIVVLVTTGLLWHTQRAERDLLLGAKVLAALLVAVIVWMAERLHRRLRDPRFHLPGAGRKPAYGEIVLRCPGCGSTTVAGLDSTGPPPDPPIAP